MEQLKKCTRCSIAKSVDEFHKDKSRRDGLYSYCLECAHTYKATYHRAHPERSRARVAAWQKANPEKVRARRIIWKKANPEKVRASNRANPERTRAAGRVWYAANAEKSKIKSAAWIRANPDKSRAHRLIWKKNNPDRVNAQMAKRRASQIQATPPWTNVPDIQAAILAFYTEATRRTREEGCSFHVDHIVPLQGRNVSGLHVPWNLQVITGQENTRKGNHWIS